MKIGEGGSSPDLTEDQLNQFFAEMKKLPLLEQLFLLIPDTDHDFLAEGDPGFSLAKNAVEAINQQTTISQQIAGTIGINVFSRCENNGQKMRMIPSMGMMQTYLKIKNPESYVQIKPIIGLCSIDEIEDGGRKQTRPLSLPFVGVELPKTADYYNTVKAYDFIGHDFYHVIMASRVPENYQKAFILVAEIMKELIKTPEFKYEDVFSIIYETAIDMEFPGFSGEEEHESAYWENLDQLIARALSKKSIKDVADRGVYHMLELASNQMQTAELINQQIGWFVSKLIDNMIKRKSEFVALGINFEDCIKQSNKVQMILIQGLQRLFGGFVPRQFIDQLVNGVISVQMHKRIAPYEC